MANILVRFPHPSVALDILQRTSGYDDRPPLVSFLRNQSDVLAMEASAEEQEQIRSAGGLVFADVQMETFEEGGRDDDASVIRLDQSHSATSTNLSLRHVMEQIEAPGAWVRSRGDGVTIVIIDTGVSPALKELHVSRRSSLDLKSRYHGQHWQDPKGHGSMCAAIAAGSMKHGGRYDGVAPDAAVVSVRSDLRSNDLTLIYDFIVSSKIDGKLKGPVVISNSYGLPACQPLGLLPADHPFLTGITTAIDRGIFVCFAAGNNHHDLLCNFDPQACSPNTIWGANSHDRVVSVGTVNRDLSNRDAKTPHVNSSRGPGEWASTTTKPDCVAPTYGEVPWGSGYRQMPWWGTSGACPQVAGAAALVLSVAPTLDPAAVSDIIRTSCRPLPDQPTCVGHGLLDCQRAVALAAVI